MRNAALIVAASITLLPVTARPWTGVDWLTLAGAAATGTMVWTAAQRLLALATTMPGMRGLVR